MTTADRLIQPPPRSSLPGAVVIIAAVVLLSIIPFSLRPRPWAAAAAAVFVIAALLAKELQAFHIALFALLLTALPVLHQPLQRWPLAFLLPFTLYGVAALAVPPLRRSLGWLKAGRLGKDIMLLALAVSAISVIALSTWYALRRPDLSLQMRHLRSLSPRHLALFGVGFSLGNAAVEEFMFRGVIMQATDSAFGPARLSILAQAVPFGAMHFLRGFPNGWWGLGMTVIYGLMLGYTRRRAQGMLAPWLAHVCADAVIFTILAAGAQG